MSKQNGQPNKSKSTPREIFVRIVAGFLCLLMVLSIVVIAIDAYANTAIDLRHGEEVGVGLSYGEYLAESFTVSAGKGFRIEIPSDVDADDAGSVLNYLSFDIASEIKTVSIASGESLTKKDGNYTFADKSDDVSVGGYKIMVSSYSTRVGGSSENDNVVLFRPLNETTGVFDYENITGYIDRIRPTIEKLDSFASPAYIDGSYYICLGSFETKQDAEAFLTELGSYYVCDAEIIDPVKDAYSVIDYQTNTVICYFSGIEELHVTPVGNEQFYANNGEDYYGRLSFSNAGDGFSIINTLHMEEYVASRLSLLLDTKSANTEALKAISAVIRTNAYSRLGDRSTHSADGFDFCTDEHCGEYRGCANIDEKTAEAVNATQDMVIKSNGEFINALYGINYGGANVSLEEAYGQINAGGGDYLVSQLSAWEDYKNNANGSWSCEITPYEMYLLLTQRTYDSPIKGNIEEINVISRAENGVYVTEIEFVDIFGNKTRLKGSEVIRNLLAGAVKSSNFVVGVAGDTVKVSEPVYDAETKENSLTEKEIILEGTYGNFVFVGSGTGSGLGLSINGANDLANKGYSYENAYVDIIKAYYKDVTVEKAVIADGEI